MQVRLQTHPPERRRRHGHVAACCCCSCCCCLHSVGGLIGAAVVSWSRTEEESLAARLYWLSFLVVVVFAVVAIVPAEGASQGAPMLALVALVFLPAFQLAAFLLALVIALLLRGKASYSKVFRIGLWGFLCALIGLGIMWLPVLLLAK